ncbi:hypothetical protein Val02_01890 [Virgisporangium aliadipatigenens]|uniref:Bacterial transcriptional activator domain-containing protein n=1 Tax=Virgisporangium aliadipatigenens TaxID=741659 RepID=A0A8J4DN83_9ACTN|nr:BTAD domain-containing putative transcriptional regulator [Virgisporangium aliadipatigenens]GIJ43303.1 hypothetical protein Val02_01890 [Virgisporangium aliadipatigenens]
MRITTFGPLAVDGRPVRGERLAAVIRELLDARGRTVATGALVEAVWRGTPPEDAAGAVQALVARVRRLGVPVLAGAGGYRIPADGVETDAVVVRALVERGRRALTSGDPVRAHECADEARALFPESPDPLSPTRLFRDVVTLRAEAALAGGGAFDEGDLRLLVGRVPPDEPAAALLVRVLAAQGRDAEALDLVERLRADLADRYGADPSPVLAGAHLALLRGELAPRSDGAVVSPGGGLAAASPAGGSVAGAAASGPMAGAAAVASAAVSPAGAVVASPGGAAAGSPAGAVGAAPAAAAASPGRVGDPVAASAGRPGDLPASWRRAATPLVGRERDLVAVAEALREAPLVTVVATGGAGKTRLAAEIARTVRASRPVRVVELAGLRSPDEVLPAVLAVLSAHPEERPPALGPGLDGLLVLDNCEHLLDAAASAVHDLLAVAPPEFGVLATSRAPLGLVGEVVHRLPALPDDEALALLEGRARAGGAVPAWRRERALTLCRRLDNLPLALELAAARLRHMPIDDVLAGLDDRFALLDDALRGLPERHAGLWAMVDHSRELLAPGERDMLERLAVIPAPFTAELALATSGGSRGGLAILVEHSLLRLEEGDGTPRYRMLETVREYGAARLDAAGGRDTATAGLVGWAVRRAVALSADLIGPARLAALRECAAEHDNLVAALRRAHDQDDEPAAVDIAAALFALWTVRGRHREAGTWAGRLLHLDDPAARRRSAILRGTASGRPLPHADRLAWLCVLIGFNAGDTGSARLHALVRRALRSLFGGRPDEVSPRVAALAAVLPGLERADPAESLRDAAGLIARPDPYLQGTGHLIRAVLTEARQPGGDAELAYRRFEAVGDHWGMGMAAQAAGASGGADPRTDGWLRRSARHRELLGAERDARATRVLLDAQAALVGDVEAERRLRGIAGADPLDESDACQAHLALAQLARHRGRPEEALAHADEVARVVAAAGPPDPSRRRAAFRVAAAVIHLWIAADARAADGLRRAGVDVRSADKAVADPDALAAHALRHSRDEVLNAHDRPLLGSWAMGGAELAAFRGDTATARELWALATRVGTNVGWHFPQGRGERLAAALGDRRSREALLEGVGARTGAVRIGVLMDALVAAASAGEA